MTSCEACPAGTVANTKHTECINVCEDGSYLSDDVQCKSCPEDKPYSYNGSACFSDSDLSGMALIAASGDTPQHIELCIKNENSELSRYAKPDHSACINACAEYNDNGDCEKRNYCPANTYLRAVRNNNGISETLWQCEPCPTNLPYSIPGGRNTNDEPREFETTHDIMERTCYSNIDGMNRWDDFCEESTFATLDHQECIEECPAGQYGKSYRESEWSSQIRRQCTMCPDGTVSDKGAVGIDECQPCGEGMVANEDHTECIPNDECPRGPERYVRTTIDGYKQCLPCSDRGVFIEGDETGLQYGCFDQCPMFTEASSDGICKICVESKIWVQDAVSGEGQCVDEFTPKLGFSCFRQGQLWKPETAMACNSCGAGSYKTDGPGICRSRDYTGQSCFNSSYYVAWDPETGTGQCVSSSCSNGSVETLSGNTRQYLGCSKCDTVGQHRFIDPTDNVEKCLQCGMGLYYDEDRMECIQCSERKPYSDVGATSSEQCREFSFKEAGYAYSRASDGSWNRVACLASKDRYAPANFMGSCMDKESSMNQRVLFDYGDDYTVNFCDVLDNGYGQCVVYDRTPGWYKFGNKILRADNIPEGMFINRYNSLQTCIDAEKYDSNDYFLREYYYKGDQSEKYLNLTGDGCVNSCGDATNLREISIEYPRDGQQEPSVYEVKQCRRDIGCGTGQKQITKTVIIKGEYLLYNNEHIHNNCSMYIENGNYMHIDHDKDYKITVDFCIPDISQETGYCTIAPDDDISRLKIGLRNYINFLFNHTTYYENSRVKDYCLLKNSEPLGTGTVDKNMFDQYRMGTHASLTNAFDCADIVDFGATSPYFNYNYTLPEVSEEWINDFCAHATGGMKCDSVKRSYIIPYFDKYKKAWDYYLDGFIYLLVINENFYTNPTCSDFGGGLTNIIKNNYTYNLSTYRFEPKPGSNAPDITFRNIQFDVYDTSSPFSDKNKARLIDDTLTMINNIPLEGTPSFKCFNGTSTQDPMASSQTKNTCNSLIFDVNVYEHDHDVRQYEGICEYVCPKGFVTTTNNDGTISCAPERRGGYVAGYKGTMESQQCPKNHFSKTPANENQGIEQCTRCSLGSTSDVGKSTCTPCSAGSIGEYDEDGENICTLCPRGTYSADEGATECNKCPTGYTTADVGATSVKKCTETLDTLKIKGNDTWKFTFPSFLKLL